MGKDGWEIRCCGHAPSTSMTTNEFPSFHVGFVNAAQPVENTRAMTTIARLNDGNRCGERAVCYSVKLGSATVIGPENVEAAERFRSS